MLQKLEKATARFMDKTTPEPNSGCWIWLAYTNREGYGTFSYNLQTFMAHRWAYERFIGPIPIGFTIDHLCRVRPCVNPAHL